jgi:hypothetical protein
MSGMRFVALLADNEVVRAATGGSDDEEAARRGIEWMRQQYRAKGGRPPF